MNYDKKNNELESTGASLLDTNYQNYDKATKKFVPCRNSPIVQTHASGSPVVNVNTDTTAVSVLQDVVIKFPGGVATVDDSGSDDDVKEVKSFASVVKVSAGLSSDSKKDKTSLKENKSSRANVNRGVLAKAVGEMVSANAGKVDALKSKIRELKEDAEDAKSEKKDKQPKLPLPEIIVKAKPFVNFCYVCKENKTHKRVFVAKLISHEIAESSEVDLRADGHQRVELKHENPLLVKVMFKETLVPLEPINCVWRDLAVLAVLLSLFTWVGVIESWLEVLYPMTAIFMAYSYKTRMDMIPDVTIIRKQSVRWASIEMLTQLIHSGNISLAYSDATTMERLTVSGKLLANVNYNRYGDAEIRNNTILLAYHYSRWLKIRSPATFHISPIQADSSSMDIELAKSMRQGWGKHNEASSLRNGMPLDNTQPGQSRFLTVSKLLALVILSVILMTFLQSVQVYVRGLDVRLTSSQIEANQVFRPLEVSALIPRMEEVGSVVETSEKMESDPKQSRVYKNLVRKLRRYPG